MDVQAWYGSVPPDGSVQRPVECWCRCVAIGCPEYRTVRYTGALPPEWYAPDVRSGVHVSEEVDLASCTAKELEEAGLAPEIVALVAPYCGLLGADAVQALRAKPLFLSASILQTLQSIPGAWNARIGRDRE